METEKDFRGDLPGAARPETTARRWRRGLVAGAGAALLLFTVTGFDRGLPRPAAAPSTGEVAAIEPPFETVRPATRVAFGPPPIVEAVSDAPPPAGERRARLEAELDAFYRHRGGAPAWVEDGRAGAAAGALIDALAAADRHGLEPQDYRLAELSERVAEARGRRLSGRELAALDLDLSAAYLAFAADLCCGRLDGLPAAEPWGRRGGLPDLAASLERALALGPAAALAELAPPFPEYRSLAAALTRYRRLDSAGGWPEVPAGPAPRPGEAADLARMVALAERLRAERYLSLEEAARLYRGWSGDGAAVGSTVHSTVHYEEPLVGAVRRFQERHGLRPDAELGEATLAALNVPAAERARQVAVNLERWRRVPRDLGERHIRVNVAGFELSAFEDGREVLTMPVVVGTREWETPLFAEEIRWLEVNPSWHVPASIARREILPKAVEDPSYLAGNSYQLVDPATGETIDPATADLGTLAARGVRVRQSPGRGNALGRVKFIFPNPHNVYLHDTPQRSGFARSGRALSHGCVRVERPLELAGFVLGGDPEWDPERVRAAIESGRSRRIDLERPLPVYLLYWTVFEDAEGRLHFRPDVYGHDQRMAESLAEVGARRLAARGGTEGGDRLADAADPGAGDAVGAAG